MPYRELYRRRQHETAERLPRSWYVSDALELSWVEGISLKATSVMPATHLRGFIVKHNQGFFNGLTDNYTIVVSDGLPIYEERFVVIKELMHCYFSEDPSVLTDSEILLDAHLRQFFGNSASSPSSHVKAEAKALWMAFGVLCPERVRIDLKQKCKEGTLTIESVSDRLGIATGRVKTLFSEQFEDEIRDILN